MIILYVHALAATGVVRNVRILAAELAARGLAVELVTALPGGEGVTGVPHHALLAGPHPSRRREKIKAIMALRRHLRTRRRATLISAGNHGHVTAWAAAQGLRDVRRIYRISNDIMRSAAGAPSGGVRRLGRTAMARLLAYDADHLVLVSPTLADTPAFASAARAGKVAVIPNGIDADAARFLADGPVPHRWLGREAPVILAIGRLAPQKNFGTLLEAFAILRRTRPARLIILGESRDRACDSLRAQAMALGVADDLDLPGTVDNVFPWLAHADAFVLPSWWEGSPNVLLEAMALDVPIIASCSAGNAADLLDGGRYGLLVDPADAVAMAGAMARQLDRATAIWPGDRIDHFGLDRLSDAWIDLLR
ncbi:glycosyltransferase [Sphingobium sp. AP49]|uniref:glycosyltransferase n=1 Tax=Sphingobium sp. AP49 TaxID=1144307 RepID=UPI00026ED73B|nr:glycosyltransferase [Sphingobium sp. AP49]WHO38624.1 glycosyltransferase [Sphingobium sp. AP49]